jgi:hypothetical protein
MPLTPSSFEENLKQVKKLLQEKPKVSQALETCKNSGGTELQLGFMDLSLRKKPCNHLIARLLFLWLTV